MWNIERGGKRLLEKKHINKESLCRWLSLLLGFCMVVSLLGGVVYFPAFAREIGETELREETREEIETRLLRQIKEEDWNPYSADMSVDEFYVLMDLFQENTLPLEGSVTNPDFNVPDDEESDANDLYIPSTMFLFSGLNTESLSGMDTRSNNRSKLPKYQNDTGDASYIRPPEE